jgi:hypothetical protein
MTTKRKKKPKKVVLSNADKATLRRIMKKVRAIKIYKLSK